MAKEEPRARHSHTKDPREVAEVLGPGGKPWKVAQTKLIQVPGESYFWTYLLNGVLLEGQVHTCFIHLESLKIYNISDNNKNNGDNDTIASL